MSPSARTRELTLDPWTFLEFKPSFARQNSTVTPMPHWVGDHRRRLHAYVMLESYYKNAGREHLDPSIGLSETERRDRREYGDAAVVVETIKSSVLGKSQTLVTENKDQLQALQKWMKKERFQRKMVECEGKAALLGDGVYSLGWNDQKKRPVVHVWDPGTYFPVLDPSEDEEFPSRVHIAYEYDDEIDGKTVTLVRKITWDLRQVDEWTPPYAEEGETATVTCFLNDRTWKLDNFKKSIEDLDPDNPYFTDVEELDLEIDFIPVVHIPNTVAGMEHFGVSSMSAVLGILDDLISTDTDLASAAATTGTPPIAIHGITVDTDDSGNFVTYGPGEVFQVGEGGATMIDTSRSLDALLKLSESLLTRLSVNSRIPESLLGRLKPSEVPSGIALALSFSPHSSLIDEMRLVRKEKYSLLFKMVSRFLMLNGDLDTVDDVEMEFGPYLPANVKEVMDVVQQGLNSTPAAISTETAVRMLLDAGLPIEDARAEVRRIEKEDFDAAESMLGASGGDLIAVRKRLGLPTDDIPGPGEPNPTPGPAGPPNPEPEPGDRPLPPGTRILDNTGVPVQEVEG